MEKYTFFTILLAVFIALLGIGIIVPVMPVFAKELGAGGLGIGLIIASFSITRGILQPIIGNMSDRIGRKGFLIAGLLIYGVVGLLIPMAATVNHLITIRGFHGIGSAMIVPIAMAYMSLLAPSGQEGRYMSYLNIAIFSGIGCGPIVGGFFYDLWGFAAVFHSMAGLSFLAFVLVVIFMPKQLASDQPRSPRLIGSLLSMLKSSKTSGILIARYSTMIIMVPTMAFLPLLMSDWSGSSGIQIGIVIACRTLVNAVLQVPFGKLADSYNKLIVLFCCCTALSVILFVIPYFDDMFSMAMAYLALGTVEAGIWANLGAYASVEAKKHYGHGTMMGVFSFAMSAGVFTGAMLAGISMDGWGIVRAYQVTAICVLLLSCISIWMIAMGERAESKVVEADGTLPNES